MTDISVIILVGKEELHIKRSLERLAPLAPRQIFIVESQKGDNTHDLAIQTAKKLCWQVNDLTQARPDVVVPSAERSEDGRRHTSQVETSACAEGTCVLNLTWHDWPKLQSVQFNWALDNLPIEGAWVLRLDADEYLSPELIDEIREKIGEVGGHAGRVTLPNDIAGVRLRLERIWQGNEIRHATNGIMQVRMFRRGKGRYLETLMDERLVVDGEVVDLHGAFYDASLMPLEEWKRKQLGYAKREAQQALAGTSQDWRKRIYYWPIFAPIRPFAYFCIRYFLKLGFLDGRAGWSWNYWQALWYRTQVEREIRALKRANSMTAALEDDYERIHEMHKNDPI